MVRTGRTPRCEQETLIRIGTGDDTALVDTSSPILKNRLQRLGFETRVEGTAQGVPRRWSASLPVSCVSRRAIRDWRRDDHWKAAQLELAGLADGAASEVPRAETETTIQWYGDENVAHLCTTSPVEARRLIQRYRYDVRVLDRGPDGSPRSWETTIPLRFVRLSRVRAKTGDRPRRENGRFRRKDSTNGGVLAEESSVPTSGSSDTTRKRGCHSRSSTAPQKRKEIS